MGARVKALLSSFGARLLIPLFVIVAIVIAGHAVFSFRSTQQHFLRFVAGEAYRSSGLIRRATHDGMLLNRLGDVQAMIERLAQGSEFAAIRVYDKRGTIVLSSDRNELGHQIRLETAPCTKCHAGRPSPSARLEAADVTRSGDQRAARQLSVIEKEPACMRSGCHDRDDNKRVLGVLDVEMSMIPLERALATARIQLIWTTVVLMLVIGLVAAFVVRRLVHQPIRRMQEATRRIASGDLTTRIDVQGSDELALLGHDFNRMAEDLNDTHREITEWSQTLEQKVADKTTALQSAQRQVLHMEKMASLGKLSATVAHELNNPISGMLTYARLVERELVEQPIDSEVRKEIERYLHLVQRECIRCGDIVQNLLVFARRSSTALTPIDINEIVDRSLMLVHHHLEMRGIRQVTEPLQGSSMMVADAGQLQQAFVALFVNAVEAMQAGGELKVAVHANDGQVFIDVSDTGTGIPADVLPLIFEPFFSTKGNESGVGLGLAVVYGIVHRHGGTIEVESEVGVGTTFHLQMPRNPPGETPAETRTAAQPGTGVPAGV